MSEELARLKAAATSPDLYERAAASERLVPFAEQPDVAELLLRLLLDDRDPYVTMRTSEALLDRDVSQVPAAATSSSASRHTGIRLARTAEGRARSWLGRLL